MAVLALPQQVARAADLQIPHGDAEAGTEGRELPDSGEPLLGDVGQGLVPPEVLSALQCRVRMSLKPAIMKEKQWSVKMK